MVRSAKRRRIAITGSPPMDRMRDALARHTLELIDRWDRQLRAAAEAQRAAVQSSLLRDFVADAMLEALPGISPVEQRSLGDALAHASVEVLVRAALDRERVRRRREMARLGRLAHELRNSATAA